MRQELGSRVIKRRHSAAAGWLDLIVPLQQVLVAVLHCRLYVDDCTYSKQWIQEYTGQTCVTCRLSAHTRCHGAVHFYLQQYIIALFLLQYVNMSSSSAVQSDLKNTGIRQSKPCESEGQGAQSCRSTMTSQVRSRAPSISIWHISLPD